MNVGRAWIVWLAALVLGTGCSDADTDHGAIPPVVEDRWEDVHPPTGVDIDVCSTISNDGEPDSVSQCGNCCQTSGYAISSFINQNRCTCAHLVPPDEVICASEVDDGTTCNDCCKAASYEWSDYTAAPTPSCSCDMKNDRNVCAQTTSRAAPADQCALCCLNHGFINAAFTALGNSECGCS